MSLDSYAALKVELQGWLNRADQLLNVDTCIDLFEAWANRNFRVRQMEQEAVAPASEYLALPSDFLELRDIQWQGNPRVQLGYMTPQQADDYDRTGSTGTPHYYTLVGDQIRLIRAPDDNTTNIRIDYWAQIPALSDTVTTNWLLKTYPDAYLYGPLMHGNVRIADPAFAQVVGAGFGKITDEIERAGRSSNYGSLLQIRGVRGV